MCASVSCNWFIGILFPHQGECFLCNSTWFFFRLKSARVLAQWVGLRPYRLKGVRLEHELYQGKLNVIHNYGHGGCGVTLSWGCAGTVVQLVKEIQLAQPHL